MLKHPRGHRLSRGVTGTPTVIGRSLDDDTWSAQVLVLEAVGLGGNHHGAVAWAVTDERGLGCFGVFMVVTTAVRHFGLASGRASLR